MIYLCGPINGRSDDDCTVWREQAKDLLGPENCLDPMRRDYRGREAESVNEIVQLDKIDIQNSTALLVYFDKPSVGTSMEVFLSWSMATPVVVVDRSDRPLSPWLVYHSTKVVDSVGDAVAWLRSAGLA